MTTHKLTPEQHIMAEQAWQDTQAEAAYEQMTGESEREKAREDTARRLDRLAQFVRQSTATVEQLDEAYAETVKCAGEVRRLLEAKA